MSNLMATGLVVLSAAMFAVGSFLGKTLLKDLPSNHVYLMEAAGTLTVALCVLFFYRKEVSLLITNFTWTGYLFGLLWGVGTVLFIIGLKYKPASIAVPLNVSLYPLIVVLLSAIFLKEVITFKAGLGIAFAILGAFLLAW